MENGDGDCDESWSDTVLSYTLLVNGVLTTNVAGDPDNPVYGYQPITSAVFVKVEISSPSAQSHGHEQAFHVRASSWVAKAELNYDFYEKQRAQLSKLKENGEAMLSKEDQTILPEIQTYLIWCNNASRRACCLSPKIKVPPEIMMAWETRQEDGRGKAWKEMVEYMETPKSEIVKHFGEGRVKLWLLTSGVNSQR